MVFREGYLTNADTEGIIHSILEREPARALSVNVVLALTNH